MPLKSSYFFTITFYFFSFLFIYSVEDYSAESGYQWLGLHYLLTLDFATTILKCFGALFFAKSAKYFLVKKKSAVSVLLIISGFFLLVYINNNIQWNYRYSYFYEGYRGPFLNYINIEEVFIPYLIGISIEMIFAYLKQFNEQQNLKLEKTKAELSFLKAQISPHFLFNTINTIFWLIVKAPKDAQDLLLKLSDMLRYQLYECDHDYVPIQKEIDYLNDLIKIQSYRKGKNVEINTEFNCENPSFPIPPLLFLPLVENALKFVSQKNEENNFISIHLFQKNGHVDFKIKNSTDDSHVELNEDKKYSGIGLNNIKKRLKLIFGEEFIFSTNLENNTYHANIQF